MSRAAVGALLEEIHRQYHRPEYIHPDPLEFLHAYPAVEDRELVAFLAAGLAYGNMSGILRSVRRVLDVLGPQPAAWLRRHADAELADLLRGFQHRWTSADDVVVLLRVLAEGQRQWGGVGEHLARQIQPADCDLQPALVRWVGALQGLGLSARHSLVADPSRGSACKRLYLLARWMVRQDAVDPGGWSGISPALLLVPVDVHLHRMARRLGFTRRRVADLRTAREITGGFRRYDATDPVRFDFSLTRMPLHDRLEASAIRARLTVRHQK
jgi:uncharacterized protein (TIGR02757 family)